MLQYKNDNNNKTGRGIFMDEDVLILEDIPSYIKDRWKLVLSMTLTTTIVAAVLSFFIISPKYEAKTKLFIGKESSSEQTQNYNSSDIQMYQKLLKTYSDVILTDDLVESALSKNNIDVSTEDVLSKLAVNPKTDTQILEISYVSTDKEEAMKVVDAVTNKFIETSSTLIANANVKIVQNVKLPQSPISPNKKLFLLIGVALGLVGGSAIAVFLGLSDNTFKDKDQVESIVNLPVIGTIPNSDIIK